MRIRVLGRLEVVDDDDATIGLGGPLERRVLAALVTQPGNVASADTLVDAVFGGDLVDGSLMRLQNHVFRLRKRLGPRVITTEGSGYRLDTNTVTLDWQRFEELVTRARSEPDASSVGTFAEALALWRGPALAELENWSPAVLLAGRLTELRRAAEEDYARAMIGTGWSAEAAALLQTLVVEEPLREQRWSLLMLALHDTGRHADALRAFQRARHELAEIGLEPGPELCSAEAAIAAGDPTVRANSVRIGRASSLSESRGNLPRPHTEWFGDRAELQRRADALPERRLVTLTGPGGVGKTRTAVEAARLAANRFAGGVWFVDLAPIADPDVVAVAVASTFGVAPQPGMTPVETIVDWLRGRRTLLIVDNCEHVLSRAAELIAAVNAACDTVTVLATSREPLGLLGERVVPIRSLAEVHATDLFRDRAQAADEGMTFADADLAAIATICRRLDGIPLAIELAAARVRSASLADLLARLDNRFRLLRGGGRGGVERHQTLRASVAWSHQLLSEAERTVFDRLSVFAGSFDASAAETVAGDASVDALDVLNALDALVDKSMVLVDRGDGAIRYRLLETLRQFGEERLIDRGETTLRRDRHLAHYLGVAARTHELWTGPRQAEADVMFDSYWDNLRAAHQWASVNNDRAGAAQLVGYVDSHAQCRMRSEVGDWARRTLDLAGPEFPPDADLYGRLAHWTMYAADFPTVIMLGELGIAVAPTPEHPDTTLCRAFALVAMLASGQLDGAGAASEALGRVTAKTEDPYARTWGWSALCLAAPALGPANMAGWVDALERDANRFGSPYVRLGAKYQRAMKQVFVDDPPDLEAAQELARRGLEESRHIDDRQAIGQFMLLSIFATLMGGSAPAPVALSSTISVLHDTRNWVMTWVALECAGASFAHWGSPDAAATVEGFLGHRGLAWSIPRWSAMRAAALSGAAVHAQPGAEERAANGAAMSPHEVVAFTLDQVALVR